MCDFFVRADPIDCEQRSRTIRIHGVLTSLRLENMVWNTLAELAEREGCTTNALVSRFHDEILAHRGEVPNFASFLRVTCLRYLKRAADLAASRAGGAGIGPLAASATATAVASASTTPAAAAGDMITSPANPLPRLTAVPAAPRR